MIETKRERYIRLLSGLTDTGATLTANATAEVVELLKEPTVGAAPVVRCKDCKWCNMGECEHKLGLIWANDENYCSLGERKDGEQHD